MLRRLIGRLSGRKRFSFARHARRDAFRNALARQAHVETLEARWLLVADPISLGDIGVDSAHVEEFVEIGGTTFFSASSEGTGIELWKTDGTPGGTSLVKDIRPGYRAGHPRELTNVGGTLFFRAIDGSGTGVELWKSDGTTAGTVMVKDIRVGGTGSYPSDLTSFNGLLYFEANDGVHKRELWKSDGTSAGTEMLVDIAPGSGSSIPDSFTVAGSTLFFRATGAEGRELWKTDGTAPGTALVKDIDTSGNTNPSFITAVGSSVYFRADDGVAGEELWKSDGTTAGTVLVKDIRPGGGDSFPAAIASLGDQVFFGADDGINGFELWTTDGTAAGTMLFKDILSGAESSSPSRTTAVGSRLFFQADDGVNGVDLWTSDGTVAGTVLLKDINPGSEGSYPVLFTDVGGTTFFTAYDTTSGWELWKTDGTTAGTVLVKDIEPGLLSAYPSNFTNVGGELFFSAIDADGVGLFKSDGTVGGTAPIAHFISEADSFPTELTALGGKIFFEASGGSAGYELWSSDGTAAGTVLVKDVEPGSEGSYLRNPAAVGDTLFFQATDSTHDTELWKSDGTTAGTVLVKDINPGSGYSAPYYLTDVNGTLFFSADDGSNGYELWKSDGTAAGTVLVKDINPGSDSSYPFDLVNVNGTLFFSADNGTNGIELWKSDGTVAGTVQIKDINPGSDDSIPYPLHQVGGTLFFAADDGTTGDELWKSDGTAAGTVLVKDIFPGDPNSGPNEFFSIGDTLFFTADDGTTGEELWKTDGTTAGTVLVKDIEPGPDGSEPNELSEVNGTLLFAATVDGLGRELWRSDGSSAGTAMVKDIDPSGSAFPADFHALNGLLFFAADDGVTGNELWQSDGTAAGTVLVKDLVPGGLSSFPGYLNSVNGKLFFSADDGVSGDELWVLVVPDTVILPPGGGASSVTFEGGNIVVRDSGGAILFQEPADEVAELVIDGEDGVDDTLTIDFTDGNPIPAGGITFNGGAGGMDEIVLFDGDAALDAETIAHTLVNPNDGSIEIDVDGVNGFESMITYTGLEPVLDNLNATNRVFEFLGGSETILVSDDGDAGDGQSFIDSDLGESITFTDPTSTLTIDTTSTAGADTINVEGLDSTFAADLIIIAEPGGGNDDTLNFRTNATSTGGGSIVVSAYNVNVNAALRSGGGAISIMADNDIVSNAGGTITSGGGTVSLIADGDGDSDGTINYAGDIDHGNGGTTFSLADADGTLCGAISGAGGIIKNGGGTLTLDIANSYGGTTEIADGTLALGTFNVIPSGSAVTVAALATFDNGGNTETIGSLAGAGTVRLSSGAGLTAGGDNSSTEFSGQITGIGSLVSQGTGALTLSGSANNWTGGLVVAAGRLLVTGALTGAANAVSVLNGSVLGGTGSIAGVINSGLGTIAPGLSPGRLTGGGQLQMNNASTFAVELDGTAAGTQYDQFVASGVAAPSLGNATLAVTRSFVPVPGDRFTIIDNQTSNAVNGTFAGLPEGASVDVGGVMLEITYQGGTGNDVELSVPAAMDPTIYLSLSTSGTVDGVGFRNEDILRFDTDSSSWSLHFDGSDVGLRTGDINAMHVNPDTSILLSLSYPKSIAGLGRVDDSDIIRFIPASLGDSTSGRFEMFLDGSTLGLSSSAEDIDGLSVDSGGRLVISTLGAFSVPGAAGNIVGNGGDLLVLNGSPAAGTWESYLDGSAVGLTTSAENIYGLAIRGSEVNLVMRGNFAVPGLSGDANDVFRCIYGSPSTCGPFAQVLEGTAQGLAWERIDGLSIVTAAVPPLHADMRAEFPVAEPLQPAVLAGVVEQAIEDWRTVGVDTTPLNAVNIEIAELPGTYLGLAYPGLVVIDSDAAGYGWQVGAGSPASQSSPTERMDLRTAVAHELGHLLGFDHGDDVMRGTLRAGQSLLPRTHQDETRPSNGDEQETDWSEAVDQIYARLDVRIDPAW